MGLADKLKASGFKATESVDGEYKPLKGTYGVVWKTLRKEIDEKNGNAEFLQVEWDATETLEGDTAPTGGKYPTFRKRYYFPDDNATPEQNERAEKKWKELLDWAFTFGVDADLSSDDAMVESLKGVVGKTGYIRAWGWTPDGGKAMQMLTVQKASVAEKKKNSTAVPF